LESKEDIKKMFPHLYKELEDSENKVKIDSVRESPQQAEAEVAAENQIDQKVDVEDGVKFETSDIDVEVDTQQKASKTPAVKPDKFRNYNPTVIDFLRRCDNAEQAEEIISYLQKKGELNEDHAKQLRKQLEANGVRSFGPKKETDYYFKESGLC
jgi:hypothetical protein